MSYLVQGDEQDIDVQESDLAPEDLQAFKRAAATGQLASLVQPWVPWWSLPEAAEVQLAPSGESKVILQGKSGKICCCNHLYSHTIIVSLCTSAVSKPNTSL